MATSATGTRKLKRWDDTEVAAADGVKLTESSVDYTYEGDVTGEATLRYAMVQRPDGSATFTGLERVEGAVGGRSGSFVLRHDGELTGGKASVTWSVVAGSGTGELAGLSGDGGFEATPEEAGNASYTLSYDLA